MHKVYSSTTPNGHQVPIMMVERTPAVRVIRVDIGTGERFRPGALASTPAPPCFGGMGRLPGGRQRCGLPDNADTCRNMPP